MIKIKFSRREKILFCILGTCILIYIINITKNMKISSDSNDYEVKLNESYENMVQSIKMKNIYENKVYELTNEISSLNILKNINQEDIISNLNNYSVVYNVKVGNISFTDNINETLYMAGNTNGDSSMETQTENDGEGIVPQIYIISTTINIEFECTYDNMLLYIDGIQSNLHDIALISISAVNYDKGMVHGKMSLNFYAMPMAENES